MKIVAAETRVEELPLSRPYTIALRSSDSDRRGQSPRGRRQATQVGGFPRALRRTAYATAIITFASHEANAPILTPHIPAMIAAATMALIATQTPQRRSALR